MILPEAAQAPTSSEFLPKSRRNLLSTLGMTSLGLMVSSSIARAASPGKPASGTPRITVPTSSGQAYATTPPALRYEALPDLPDEWSAQNGAAVASYLRYLNSLNLRSVCPKQVVEAHAKQKCSVWNTLPPKVWWNRMGYVLRVVDRIAKEMNISEVEIVSAYRAPAYNSRCPGARAGSWHQANVAADVKFPVRASLVTRSARQLRDLGLFKGGIGGYWNFTHIDARGENINW